MPDTLNADVRLRLDLATVTGDLQDPSGPKLRQAGHAPGPNQGDNTSGWGVGSWDLAGHLADRYGVTIPTGENIYLALNAEMTARGGWAQSDVTAGVLSSGWPQSVWLGVGRSSLAARIGSTASSNPETGLLAATAQFRGGPTAGPNEELVQGFQPPGRGSIADGDGTTPLTFGWHYETSAGYGAYTKQPDTSIWLNVLYAASINWHRLGRTEWPLLLGGWIEITLLSFVGAEQSSLSPAAANDLAALTAAVSAGYETVGTEDSGTGITLAASRYATVLPGPAVAAGKVYEIRTGGGHAVLVDGDDIAGLPQAAHGNRLDLRDRTHHVHVWRDGAGMVAEDVLLARTDADRIMAQWEVPQALAAVRYVELARRAPSEITAAVDPVRTSLQQSVDEVVADLKGVEAVQRAADYTAVRHGGPITITAAPNDDGATLHRLTGWQFSDAGDLPPVEAEIEVSGYTPVRIDPRDLQHVTLQPAGTLSWGPGTGQHQITDYYRAYPLYRIDTHERHGYLWVGSTPSGTAGMRYLVVAVTTAGTYTGVQVVTYTLTSGAGISQAEADARIAALVEPWALLSGSEGVPASAIADAAAGLITAQVGRRTAEETQAVYEALWADADTTPAAVTAAAPDAAHELAGSSALPAGGRVTATLGAGYDRRYLLPADQIRALPAAAAGDTLDDNNSIEVALEADGAPAGITARIGRTSSYQPLISYSQAGAYSGVRIAAATPALGAHIAAHLRDSPTVTNPVGPLIMTAAIPATGIVGHQRINAVRWTRETAYTTNLFIRPSHTVRINPRIWGDSLGLVCILKVAGTETDRAYVPRPLLTDTIDTSTDPDTVLPTLPALTTGTAAIVFISTGKRDDGTTFLSLRGEEQTAGMGDMPADTTLEVHLWVSAPAIGPGGVGLGQTEVDARIRAVVDRVALAANADRWPDGKVPDAADHARALEALTGADRLSYDALRGSPPDAGTDSAAVQRIVDATLLPVRGQVGDLSATLADTEALTAALYSAETAPWQALAPYPLAGVARPVAGAVWARGGFHRLYVDRYGDAGAVALIDDSTVLGYSSVSVDTQLGAADGMAVALVDSGGRPTGETAYLGRGDDGAAYISFDTISPSLGGGWRVRLEALAPAPGPVAHDDTLTGAGTTASPLAVSSAAELPPVSLTLSSRAKVLARLNVDSESDLPAADLAQIDELLAAVREWAGAALSEAGLASHRADTAVTWMAAQAYQLRAQGIAEVAIDELAQMQMIDELLRGIRSISM